MVQRGRQKFFTIRRAQETQTKELALLVRKRFQQQGFKANIRRLSPPKGTFRFRITGSLRGARIPAKKIRRRR